MKAPVYLAVAIRLLTHNVRYATTAPFKGEELWPVRAPRLLNELRFNTRHNEAAFICLQEVLHNQLDDIMAGLNEPSGSNAVTREPEWAYIGVGREDGKTSGEYSPILYRPKVWKLDNFQTFWLSETPNKPSKGWDAASTRIVTIGVFQHITSSRLVIAMNTHMDDQGTKAREEGAKLILGYIRQYLAQYQAAPVFLAGDFNSETNEEAYKVFSAPDSPIQDLRDQVAEKDRYGDNNTFTGFGYDQPTRIDFLFLGKGQGWQAKGYGVLENKFEDGVYNSDHRAVAGDVLMS